MTAIVTPYPLHGAVLAPPSKSELHRALICSALADRATLIRCSGGGELPEDIAATVDCLRELGAKVKAVSEGLEISPIGAELTENEAVMPCRESGTTLRFLLPIAAALGRRVRFCGGGRLCDRPVVHLLDMLAGHGTIPSSRRLPLTIRGRLSAGEYELPGDISSQYVSGLIMALPLLDGDSTIRLTGRLQSEQYADLTIKTVSCFGVKIYRRDNAFTIPGGQQYRSPGRLCVGGDWSAAALLLAGGVLGSGVTVRGLDMQSAQGDREVTELLRRFGARVEITDAGVTAMGGELRGCDIDVRDVPDLLPPLCAVAAFSVGETHFTGGARLRLKESDRLSACCRLITALGGTAAELPDGLTVVGGGMTGGCADSCGDHRIAMTAAMIATRCREEVCVQNAQCVGKSYPGFWRDVSEIGCYVRFD